MLLFFATTSIPGKSQTHDRVDLISYYKTTFEKDEVEEVEDVQLLFVDHFQI